MTPFTAAVMQVAESAADAAGGGGGGLRFYFVCGFCKWSGLRPAEGAPPATVGREGTNEGTEGRRKGGKGRGWTERRGVRGRGSWAARWH